MGVQSSREGCVPGYLGVLSRPWFLLSPRFPTSGGVVWGTLPELMGGPLPVSGEWFHGGDLGSVCGGIVRDLELPC